MEIGEFASLALGGMDRRSELMSDYKVLAKLELVGPCMHC